MPLYFAYGTNMDEAAVAERCPGSLPVGPGRLERHRLAVMREGYLTVRRDPRETVFGLVWDLALADVPALDRYEGVGRGLYAKTLLPIRVPDGSRRALVYVGTNGGPGILRPDGMAGVLAAARRLAVPARYLAGLQALGATASGRDRPARPVRPVSGVPPLASAPGPGPLGPAERLGRWEP